MNWNEFGVKYNIPGLKEGSTLLRILGYILLTSMVILFFVPFGFVLIFLLMFFSDMFNFKSELIYLLSDKKILFNKKIKDTENYLQEKDFDKQISTLKNLIKNERMPDAEFIKWCNFKIDFINKQKQLYTIKNKLGTKLKEIGEIDKESQLKILRKMLNEKIYNEGSFKDDINKEIIKVEKELDLDNFKRRIDATIKSKGLDDGIHYIKKQIKDLYKDDGKIKNEILSVNQKIDFLKLAYENLNKKAGNILHEDEWYSKKEYEHIMEQELHLDKNFMDIGHFEFEEFIKEVLEKMGYKYIKVTKKTGDYGVDLLANRGKSKYAIQVKRYDQKTMVGSPDVQNLHGAMAYYEATKALFITTSRFSSNALTVARKLKIECWDGEDLKENIRKYMIKSSSNID